MSMTAGRVVVAEEKKKPSLDEPSPKEISIQLDIHKCVPKRKGIEVSDVYCEMCFLFVKCTSCLREPKF